MTRPLHVAYSPIFLNWLLGEGHPTNPERARLAVELLDELVPDRVCVREFEGWSLSRIAAEACVVHDADYVGRLLFHGESSEFERRSVDLARVGASLFAGTVALMRRLERDAWEPGVSFNPMGAKHHAMRGGGAGFCVLNDLAWAAVWAIERGKRVAVLDWDVHHGDGTEAILWDTEATTLSIHQGGGFWPGTGVGGHTPESGAYNWALPRGAGDDRLLACVREALAIMDQRGPIEILFLAAGADGLGVDPLGGLTYSIAGLCRAASLVGEWAAARGTPIVVGGAGGYTPLRETPMAWAGAVASMVAAFE